MFDLKLYSSNVIEIELASCVGYISYISAPSMLHTFKVGLSDCSTPARASTGWAKKWHHLLYAS